MNWFLKKRYIKYFAYHTITNCSFVKRTLGNRKQSRFSNRLFLRAARNVPPEVVRPPPNQQQAPWAKTTGRRGAVLPSYRKRSETSRNSPWVPQHQFTASRAQRKHRGCQPWSPRRERIPIRLHISSSLSNRRESTRRNPMTRRRRAGYPTRRMATFSARSKPPRATSSASAYLAARYVFYYRVQTIPLFSLIILELYIELFDK